jgi:hypothetical protein
VVLAIPFSGRDATEDALSCLLGSCDSKLGEDGHDRFHLARLLGGSGAKEYGAARKLGLDLGEIGVKGLEIEEHGRLIPNKALG